MAKGEWGDVLRSVQTLLDQGIVASLSDRQLLERFADRVGASAQTAFAALVARHGAMVLRVCRSILRDEQEAQDAFQATFLVLARKAGSIWVRDSLGPWLHGVAYRTSSRRRSASARRRAHERRAAERSLQVKEDPESDDLGRVLHEELDRLPDRFRNPIILCYLEGMTHEQAAERLRCPVGTIRSRLSAARARLRGRLERRGIDSVDGMLASSLAAASTSGTVPAALAESAVRVAFGSTSVGGIVPASIVAVIERGMKMTWLSRFILASVAVLALGGCIIGGLALAQRGQETQQLTAQVKAESRSPSANGPERQPLGPGGNAARRTLLEARIETARAILRIEERLVQGGERGLEDLSPWSRRLMQDRLSLATTRAERQAAIREHRNRMLILEQRLEQLVKTGQARITDHLMGKYYRLEADQLLVEQGVDLSKEPASKPQPDGTPSPTPPPVPSQKK
jgi:RNA polymerase sigma factor (sigma-70 family)